MKEAEVKKKIKTLLHEHGITREGRPNGWFFMPPGSLYGRGGIPDFIGCVNGKPFAIEAKGTLGTLAELQKLELAAMTAAGVCCVVVKDEDTLRGLGALLSSFIK